MTTFTFRCDAATEELLDSLAVEGETRSDTIRRALADADRLRRREQMRAEALTVAQDAQDLEEARAVSEQLDGLRAW